MLSERQQQGDSADGWPDCINERHRELLMSSGITVAQAIARGYETIKDPRRLDEIGIPKNGQRTMGLLIPLRTFDRSVWGYQYRPDHPRERQGKPCKYEAPFQQSNRLDIPVGVGRQLGDPSIMLWITEGAKKADCAADCGLTIVALTGVWNWRHTNESGGRTAIPDFHDIPLNDRDIVIAFDSDVARKPSPNKAMVELARYLTGKGATVRFAHLPDDGDKTGLDDFLATHTVEELMALVRPEPPACRDNNGDLPYPPNNTATPQHSWSGVVPGVARLRRIRDAVAAEVQLRGLVGEECLAQTLYLVFTSRLLDKQVSAGVKGHSASGKSYTVEAVTKFFPPEAFLEFTAMSEHALVYSPEEYAHRTIVIYEVTALREGVEDDMTSYFIRTLLSEGRIVYDVTTKDRDGQFTTRKITKEGPTNLVFTTTKTRVHAENETRILSLVTDDSTAQTARVLLEIADEGNGANALDDWVDLQRWLASEHAERRVTIPYATELARLVPPVAVRLRRDFGSVLALVRAHAMLHQLNRARDPEGRIIATHDDYAVVRELVGDTITEGVGATVSATVRETVAAVAHEASGQLEGASVRAIGGRLRIDISNAGRRLRVAADGGYITNLETRRGYAARWVVGDPMPDSQVVLPEATQLATPDITVDLECCGVAAASEEGDATQSAPTSDEDHATCRHCGQAMCHPVSRARGYCEKCRLTGRS